MARILNKKTAIGGDKIYQQFLTLIEQSEMLNRLKSSELVHERARYQTLLNELRKIAFSQVAMVYGSDAGKELRGQDKRIDKPDYEKLAEEYLAEKLGRENATDFLSGKKDLIDCNGVILHNILEWFEEFTTRVGIIQSHTRNQTPHPTISTTVEAYQKEAELIDFLQQAEGGMRGLLERGEGNFEPALVRQFIQKVEALADTLAVPLKPLKIEQEMKMSLRQSYNIYRSIPEHALDFMRVAEKTFGLDIQENKELRQQLLEIGGQAIRNETWSPGDVDSKPHMRPAQMEAGIRMGRVAIRKQYIEDIAKIAVELPSGEGRSRLETAIWQLLGEIEAQYPGEEGIAKVEWFINNICPSAYSQQEQERLKQKFGEIGAVEHIAERERERRKLLPVQQLLQQIHDAGRAIKINPEYDLKRDIAEIAELPEVQKIKYRDITGTETRLAAIDALQMQVNSYGMQAQRITHRQSSEVYATAMTELHKFVATNSRYADALNAFAKKSGYPVYGDIFQRLASLEKAETPENAALSILHQEIENQRPEWTKNLIEFLKSEDPLANALRKEIQDLTQQNMEYIRQWQSEYDAQQKASYSEHEQRTIYTYESLEMIRIGMYSNGAVARELIAETNHAEALWNVMALQELMKDPQNPPAITPKIVPLVEYPDDIEHFADVMSEAYSFKPFLNDQRNLTNKQEHSFLQVWDADLHELRDMQIGDMIAEIKREERRGEETALEIIQGIMLEQRIGSPELETQLSQAIKTLRDLPSQAHEQRNAIYESARSSLSQHEELNTYLAKPVFYVEGMTAGSDAQKSGSSALLSVISDNVSKSRKEIAKVGGYFVQKWGNGSAAHRSAINNALIRMRQGLEMAQGPEMLTRETSRIRSLAAARKLGVTIGVSDKQASAAQIAIVNLGNAAGIRDTTSDENYELLRQRDKNRVQAYQALYDDKDFSQFIGSCTPQKLQGIFKFAARPAGRIGTKGFNVKTMRAIGYGLANGATFGQPTLNYGLAEFVLEADEDGMFKAGNAEQRRKQNREIFLASPDMQNEINRSIIDLAQYQPEVGWQNTATGCRILNAIEREIDKETGEVIITFRNHDNSESRSFSLQQIIAMEEQGNETLKQNFLVFLGTHMRDESYPEKARLAPGEMLNHIRMAAKLDWEATKALRAVNQLVADSAAQQLEAPLDIVSASSQDVLINNIIKLSPQLGEELRLIREEQCRNLPAMAAVFEQTEKHPATLPVHPKKIPQPEDHDYDQKIKEYLRYEEMSQPFKRHNDITENVPAAYYEPGHAVAVSIAYSQQKAMAA